ncbi:MAG: hypothetical protein A3A33_03340 [Candidatus Yanofskybacteria bacterium RIFCSPLOWO2_01_FULL_49_25]|uniref:Uncharacterized protein n=1 Tax=Candidatus Yanofskybacteria bacterium RIFCSPLOWO2_01_FULL_49_25 TaxID=1802701 RepID=A0A1F8GVS7_9BACT|nr:MAG: hypothetical protein A3A33_03340 [Candidatus Yanofskybacteria bacterium RIFCSPLOWO2_01_FULL_49_25]
MRPAISWNEARELYAPSQNPRPAQEQLPNDSPCKKGHPRKRNAKGKLGCPTCAREYEANKYREEHKDNRCRKCGRKRARGADKKYRCPIAHRGNE